MLSSSFGSLECRVASINPRGSLLLQRREIGVTLAASPTQDPYSRTHMQAAFALEWKLGGARPSFTAANHHRMPSVYASIQHRHGDEKGLTCHPQFKANSILWSGVFSSPITFFIPFSAFWLRSSVVSVLISLIADTGSIAPYAINLISLWVAANAGLAQR